MNHTKFVSIWDAIEDTAVQSQNMKLRSKLMIDIVSLIKKKGWNQTQAAKQLSITQPRVSDLMRGKINLFSLDTLVNLLATIGMQAEIQIAEAA